MMIRGSMLPSFVDAQPSSHRLDARARRAPARRARRAWCCGAVRCSGASRPRALAAPRRRAVAPTRSRSPTSIRRRSSRSPIHAGGRRCAATTAPPAARPWDAPPGDRDNPVAVTIAPADADGRRAPGARARSGRERRRARRPRLPARSHRRCASRLDRRRRRGAAGAHADVAARQRRRRRIRREPVVGVGDSVRTVDAAAARPAPRRPRPRRRLARPEAGHRAPAGAAASRGAARPRRAGRAAVTRARRGPLDAERGARSFDNEQPGQGRRQRHAARGLERAAPGPDRLLPAGGAGADRRRRRARPRVAAPGAVARPASGTRRQPAGRAPTATPIGAGRRASGRWTRRYQRYELEISSACNGVLRVSQGAGAASRTGRDHRVRSWSASTDGWARGRGW